MRDTPPPPLSTVRALRVALGDDVDRPEVQVIDGTPLVTYHASATDEQAIVDEIAEVAGALAGVLKETGYPVDRIDVVTNPPADSSLSGRLTWHIKTLWVKAYFGGPLAERGFLKRVEATVTPADES